MNVVFSTESVHARDRLDYWHDEASKAYVAHEFNSHVGRSFRGEIRAGALGPLGISQFTCDPCLVERTIRCLKQLDGDDLLVGMQVSGSMTLRQDGREAATEANDAFLIDPRRPFAIDIPDGARTLVVKVPREELAARLGDTAQLTARPLPRRKPLASLASGYIAMLAARADAIKGAAAVKIAYQALDLVGLAFAEELAGRQARVSSSRTTTTMRLKSAIEVQLHDPALKPSVAAALVGISVRYANALLAQEGTSLERYIMNRRLELSKRALMNPEQGFRTVTEIAYAHGFSDVSHFTRRFKAEFGCRPSECRPSESRLSLR